MFARKFLEKADTRIDQLADELLVKISASGRCVDLLNRVPAKEQHESMRRILRDMSDWLLNGQKSVDEKYYVELGKLRAQRGVPFSDLLSGVCTAREYFWEYVEQETLLDQPTDFWGGVKLLHALDSCLDAAIYYAAIGYRQVADVGNAFAA